MLFGSGWLLSVGIALDRGLRAHGSFDISHRWVDILIGLIHVLSEMSSGFRLVEIEGLWLSRRL